MIACAICGATTNKPYWEAEDDAEYDPSLVSPDDVAWTEHTRIICENPKASSLSKAYVTGPSCSDEFDYCDVKPNGHPNFPTEDQAEYHHGAIVLRPFHWRASHPLAIPFHMACYELLKDAVSCWFGSEQEIDEDVLYQTLKGFAESDDEYFDVLPGIDWGPIAECQEEFWIPARGTEAFVMHPVEIPGLLDYYRNLPRRSRSKLAGASSSVGPATHDPFSKLPTELLLGIMIDLPMASVNALRAASPTVARLDLDGFFWKQKLRRDMPWLYDIPSSNNRQPDDLDWAQIYKDLFLQSQNDNREKILGLVNRRRIWAICDQIIAAYASNMEAKEGRGPLPPALVEASTTKMAALMWPEPAGTEMGMLPLLKNFEDLNHSRPVVSVFWTHERILSGFKVSYVDQFGAETKQTVGNQERFAASDDVRIKQHDWIRGFVVTVHGENYDEDPPHKNVVGIKVLFLHGEPVQLGESRGDQQLIHTTPGHFPAGIMAQWSNDGKISHFCMLQVSSIHCHTSEAAHIVRQTAEYQHASSNIITKLWKDELPHPGLTLTDPQIGYFMYDFKIEYAQMEALVFGQDEEELSHLTAVSVDIEGGAMELSYSNQPTKRIGPRPHAMKTMSIDGRGGERIVAAHVGLEPRTSLKLITNRSRQIVVGQFRPNGDVQVHASGSNRETLCGIYVHWIKRSRPNTSLAGIGGLFSPTQVAAESADMPTGQLDKNGFCWDPESPPLSWSERGVLYGRHWVGWSSQDEVPSNSAVVTWLDCSQPVDKVKFVFGHPGERTMSFTFVGITLVYSEGTTASVGPTRLTTPTDSTGINGLPWCFCDTRHYSDDLKEEVAKTDHFYWKEWTVGGVLLDSVAIWANDHLSGFQLVSEAGESPQYGTCEGSPTGVIGFGHYSGKARGLKFYMDHNDSNSTYADTVIVGMEALVQDN
ncbi:hypothetical protein BDW62DRAFT_198839 [Aspergillus aurantiobrunneus]